MRFILKITEEGVVKFPMPPVYHDWPIRVIEGVARRVCQEFTAIGVWEMDDGTIDFHPHADRNIATCVKKLSDEKLRSIIDSDPELKEALILHKMRS